MGNEHQWTQCCLKKSFKIKISTNPNKERCKKNTNSFEIKSKNKLFSMLKIFSMDNKSALCSCFQLILRQLGRADNRAISSK